MQEAARQHFLEYDFEKLCRHPNITAREQGMTFSFLGQECYVNRETGHILLDGHPANFSQSLTVYDWLCDRKANATAANQFCSVNSLPGVLVSGGTLGISGDSIAPKISQNPAKFLEICHSLQGKRVSGGDLSVVIYPLPDLPVLLKFYDGDDEFPPTLSILWDVNILQFIRYETVYYLAGCLLARLRDSF